MRRPSPLLLLPLLLPAGGCIVAVAAGTAYGITKYYKNEVVKTMDAPTDRVWRASLDALEARGYELPPGLSRELTESQDVAIVKGSGYWLRLEERPCQVTEVRIRIGNFQSKDHERKVNLLIESIEKRL